MEKKQKAEDKRMRRTQRKATVDAPEAGESQDEASPEGCQAENDAD